MSFQVRVEDKASVELRQARRDMNARTKEGLIAAGTEVALPEAKRRAGNLKVAGSRTADSLIVRGTTRSAYLTTNFRSTKARAVGLQEFGGRVTTILVPRKKKALTVRGSDHPVAIIRTPRRYTGRGFMTGAVHARADEIDEAILKNVIRAFDGFTHTQ